MDEIGLQAKISYINASNSYLFAIFGKLMNLL
jgi:hypothetical protein